MSYTFIKTIAKSSPFLFGWDFKPPRTCHNRFGAHPPALSASLACWNMGPMNGKKMEHLWQIFGNLYKNPKKNQWLQPSPTRISSSASPEIASFEGKRWWLQNFQRNLVWFFFNISSWPGLALRWEGHPGAHRDPETAFSGQSGGDWGTPWDFRLCTDELEMNWSDC